MLRIQISSSSVNFNHYLIILFILEGKEISFSFKEWTFLTVATTNVSSVCLINRSPACSRRDSLSKYCPLASFKYEGPGTLTLVNFLPDLGEKLLKFSLRSLGSYLTMSGLYPFFVGRVVQTVNQVVVVLLLLISFALFVLFRFTMGKCQLRCFIVRNNIISKWRVIIAVNFSPI